MAVYFCAAEAAIAPGMPQCASSGFGLRTCKAAMSEVRISASRVAEPRKSSRFTAILAVHRTLSWGRWQPCGCPATIYRTPVIGRLERLRERDKNGQRTRTAQGHRQPVV